jgi:hypothetical protein
MKMILITLAVLLGTTSVFAHPGSNNLVCKSAKHSGSRQSIAFELHRSNGTGWFAPTFAVSVDGKEYAFTPPDEMKSYGETIHDYAHGVVVVTAEDFEAGEMNHGRFSVTAIPKTIKSSSQGEGECADSAGQAKFKAIFRGQLRSKLSNPKGKRIRLDTQILDCELEYNSGMAC